MGRPGRTFLNLPPTFSVYDANARLTNTTVANVPRLPDFSIDEDAVLARVAEGDIDYLVVTSPNNPRGSWPTRRSSTRCWKPPTRS